jgi:hypothetical protein
MKAKFIFIVVLIVLVVSTAAFAVPFEQIPYTKKTTLEYPNDYTIRFSLCDDPVAGSCAYWSEEKTVSLTSGKIITNLGDTVSLSSVDFSQQYYVQVEKKKANGTYKVVGIRDMLGVVPYAMWSATSDAVVPGGTVTAITAGGGLTGGGIGAVTLDVGAGSGITVAADTVGIATGGVTSAMIADGTIATDDLADSSITSAKIADGTIGSADINDAQVQARVSSCGAGEAIQTVAANGAVTCQQVTTTKTGYVSVQAYGFNPKDSTTTWAGLLPGNGFRAMTGGTLRMAAPLIVPEGAVITELAGTFWDTNDGTPGDFVSIVLYRQPGGDSATQLASIGTSMAENSCGYCDKTAVLNHTVSYAGSASYYLYWTQNASTYIDDVSGFLGPGLYNVRVTYTITTP